METIITHKYAIVLAVALMVRLVIAARRFNRRGAGGLQHYPNYIIAMAVTLLEFCLNWLSLIAILWASFNILFK